MAAVRAMLVADLRPRWRITVALAIFVAIGSAVTIGAFVAAERTSTALERELRATDGADLLFAGPDLEGRPENLNMVMRADLDAPTLAGIPGVAASATSGGTPLAFPDVEGLRPRDLFGAQNEFESIFQTLPLDERFFRTIERPRLLAGRLPDPTRVDEILVSPGLASFADWEVGDTVTLSWLPAGIGAHDDVDITDPAAEETVNALMGRMTVRIVGIGSPVQRDRVQPSELVLTTPAFASQPDLLVQYTYHAARLSPGADVGAVVQAAAERGLVVDQSSSGAVAGYHDAVRPDVVSLVLFGVLSGLVTVVVIGHALGRELRRGGGDSQTLGALGATRAQLVVVGLTRAGAVILAGVVVGGLVAVLTSGWFLREPAASVDPVAGMHANALVVILASAAICVGYLAVTAGPVFGSARGRRVNPRTGPSGIVRILASRGSSLPTIMGTRHAIEGGAGPASVPARTALTVGALAASVAVAAAIFTAGLDRLTSEPSTYGAIWQLSLNTNYDNQRDGLEGFACRSPDQACGDAGQVLRALGATPGQIARTIRTTTAVSYTLVLASGVVVGSALGSAVWSAFERPTGTRAGVQWPVLELVLAAVLVGVALAVSIGIATRAARVISPGEALRSE